jgi:Tol biopolymer transport system component
MKTREKLAVRGNGRATLALLGVLAAGAAIAATAALQQSTVTMKKVTNVAATLSPDKGTLILDLHGTLHRLPANGGTATAVTDPLLEAARPHWAPAGDFVAFQAYKGGTFHIWTMKPDGSSVTQLTTGHGDDREPRVSPDGKKIVFASDRAFANAADRKATVEGSYDIWQLDVASGALTQITKDVATDEFEPTWSPDGTKIAYVSGVGATGTTIRAIDSSGASTVLVTAPAGSRLNSPSYSPDGTKIAYLQFANNVSQLMVSPVAGGTAVRVGANGDVFPFQPNWIDNDRLVYTADGGIWTATLSSGSTSPVTFQASFTLDRTPYTRKTIDFEPNGPQQVKGIVSPALSPDGRHLLFQALNQIYVMRIGGKPTAVTFDSYAKMDPAWVDKDNISYSTDRAGTMHIFVQDLRTGNEKQITSMEGAQVSSAWSKTGKLAFQDQNGATYTMDVTTGATQKISPNLFAPSKPSWSANGNVIAQAALRPYSRRFREGVSEMFTVNLTTNDQLYTPLIPFKSPSTRGEDGPVYSPDGTAVAFVTDSLLYIRPVDANGMLTGEAKAINNEVTDAPTWSGDGKTLLYLNNGRLRLISRDGGEPQTVPVDLTWKADRPDGRVVIRAGRLWDGTGEDVQTNVDIVVVNNRIKSIQPGGTAQIAASRVIDASEQTVMPGIFESHTHQYISGKFYGDRLGRLWMAYGVTELNSVGDPVYRAQETREAYAANSRVGPRYFMTGEALDGERVYYNFMRPIMDEQTLAREIERSKAMDYDMVKTYVRLPHAWQKIANEAAHAMGVYSAAHYMLPGQGFNVDGQTHVSATTRLGFAYTRSSAGISYQDMRDIFSQPGAFVISTTFNASLYAERENNATGNMEDDRRLLVLNTPWDQALLKAKATAARTTPQTVSLDSLKKEEDTVATIIRQGGVVLAGTDSPLDNVATALHLNLRAQVKYGLENWKALQTATLLPARRIGVEKDLGTVQEGKLADLAFIKGDPLREIKDLANVAGVMKNGRYYSVEELMEPFQAAAPKSTSAAAVQHRMLPAKSSQVAKYWWHDPAQLVEDEHK